MFSISLLFYESGIYGLKWLEMVQMYGEKVVMCYDPLPQGNPELGGHPPPHRWPPPPTAFSKVGKYVHFQRPKDG